MSSSYTFQARLLIFIALSTLALTSSLTVYIGIRAQSQVALAQGAQLAAHADRIADQLDTSISERLLDVRQLAGGAHFISEGSADANKRQAMNRVMSFFPEFAWLGFTDLEGTVLVASGSLLEGQSVRSRDWFQKGLERPVIVDIHGAKLLEKYLQTENQPQLRFVDVATPVIGNEGAVLGVLGAHLYSTWAAQLVASIVKPLELTPDIRVFIANSEREVIVGDRDMALVMMEQLGDTAGTGYRRIRALSGEEGFVGLDVTRAFAENNQLGWQVMVYRPASAVMAPVIALRRDIMWVGAITGVVFLILGYIATRQLAYPLRNLAEQVSLAKDVDDLRRLQVDGQYRELEELISKLKDMALRLGESDRLIAEGRRRGEQQEQSIRSLRQSVTTDALTGVTNRRGFDQCLLVTLDAARQEQSSFVLAIIDLDHFKQINDTHGHVTGDEVLKVTAQAIDSQRRQVDVFARIGGEEFALLLPSASETDAAPVLERVRATVAELRIPVAAGELALSCSIGATAFRSTDAAGSDIYARADRALYEAKQAGRNRLCFAKA